ncbi:fimbrial protein [Rahnella sp. ChDrAdgB13]|uniref:fimbrial protein n=1 Tax=Rahnella sp. ChDrAdgB13 TaxID=1850581 RepID=UPI001FCA9FC4|nr:fimbrial protein [Rahnella sp. ChDrAdgB13]
MTRYGIRTLLVMSIALFCSSLLATEVQFQGTLIEPPPCTINNDQAVLVPFGNNVGINKIDGVNYRQTVDYHLTCDSTSPRDGLTLVLSTTAAASYDTAAVNTDITGLGVRLLVDSAPAVFDTPIPVVEMAQPVIEAVPVKAPDASLAEGPFNATVTLKVVYQ